MLPDDSQGCFDKYPENKSGPFVLRLLFPFIAQVVERLLHRLTKPLPESLWVESEEPPVKPTNYFLFIHGKELLSLC